MSVAIEETDRRRHIQSDYNQEHGIEPQSIQKDIARLFETVYQPEETGMEVGEPGQSYGDVEQLETSIETLEAEMLQAARELEFEKAARLRDRIKELRGQLLLEL
jgi:excinuclease ABC subunit B